MSKNFKNNFEIYDSNTDKVFSLNIQLEKIGEIIFETNSQKSYNKSFRRQIIGLKRKRGVDYHH